MCVILLLTKLLRPLPSDVLACVGIVGGLEGGHFYEAHIGFLCVCVCGDTLACECPMATGKSILTHRSISP